jgi:hypothetical protein
VLAPAAAASPSTQGSPEWVDCDAFVLIAATNPCPYGGTTVTSAAPASVPPITIGRY